MPAATWVSRTPLPCCCRVPSCAPGDAGPGAARLFYAYADALLAAGREDEAVIWFGHAADADETGETDADERLDELAGVIVVEHDDEPDDHRAGSGPTTGSEAATAEPSPSPGRMARPVVPRSLRGPPAGAGTARSS